MVFFFDRKQVKFKVDRPSTADLCKIIIKLYFLTIKVHERVPQIFGYRAILN